MPSSDTDSWTNLKQVSVGTCYAHTLTSRSSEGSRPDFSDCSDLECLQDSVTQKRRHGVYVHRPPVWVSGSSRTESQSTAFADCTMRHGPGEECSCDGESLREMLDALYKERGSSPWPIDHDQRLFCRMTAATVDTLADIDASVSDSADVPLLVDWEDDKQKRCNSSSINAYSRPDISASSDRPLPNLLPSERSRSYRQVKPGLCTRLKFQKDIRLEVEARWAIQEGSLVICIDPSYTFLDHERQSDEFEIVSGDVYVVCQIYADLWALCAKASFIPETELASCEAKTGDLMRLGFLPLCAVTLAANYSAFSRRCARHAGCKRYPGNGLPVMPPPRSHSLTASKQTFKGNRNHLELPGIVYDGFHNTSLSSDSDYIPLDSTLEHVLARVGSRRRRPTHFGGRFSLQKIWNDVKASGVWKCHQSKGVLSFSPRNRSSKVWVSEGRVRHYLAKRQRNTISASERRNFLIGRSS
ncbi:hypothetical protein BDV28DRAFT_163542 [Aspergillus coremiiformis]|uniref:Uncharacterized protein n=1 Tax=Aspergillus coremiiformis TaxID=138285 RepID=A0A5N6YYM2_9EURO|nr:hypothetical protein BDV28DRAFT_163542 [Aspergillus coremiiformis]